MRWFALLVMLAPAGVRADNGRLLDDHTFDTQPGGQLAADAGFVVGLPSALPSGLSTGLGGGITRTCGCLFSYGARASWSRVAEPGMAYLVTQDEFRVRVTGAIRHDAGRGSIGLRLGLGPTIVHEARDRLQDTTGLTGDALHTGATRALPAGELEVVISVKVVGDWLLVASGGPSLDIESGAAHFGWISTLGVGWQP
jgi:hypothetical protein